MARANQDNSAHNLLHELLARPLRVPGNDSDGRQLLASLYKAGLMPINASILPLPDGAGLAEFIAVSLHSAAEKMTLYINRDTRTIEGAYCGLIDREGNALAAVKAHLAGASLGLIEHRNLLVLASDGFESALGIRKATA